MLCKVLSEDAADVQPAPWKRAGVSKFQTRRPGPTGSEEVLQLRATVEELGAALERKPREAYDQGFRAGELAAREALESGIRTVAERLAATISEIAAVRADIIHRAETDTVRLAIEIARRVLHRELSVDPSALEALIKAGLAKLENQEIYRVRVHPDQTELMRSCLAKSGRDGSVEVIGDAAQARGGVSFEISRGTLDASADTQLREIENGLIDEMRIRA